MNFPDLEASFESWLSSAIQRCNGEGIAAYCFNISETSDEFVVEVIGAPAYDPKDEDWACDEAWTSRPEKFLLTYAIVGRAWKPVLAMVAGWVGKLVADASDKRFQLLRSSRAVAVGFVDGDLKKVWSR